MGKHRGEETEIRAFSEEAESSTGHMSQERNTTSENPDLKDSCRALPVLSLREYATL